ncbi:MAG TPA: thiamine phosphate synthase [Candidatus Polarisedimenticolia bacterium]|nr:thiamine phosphate synthase [Candidatus Polarisedimenticolia bacterium]
MPVVPVLYPITDRALSGGLSHERIVTLLCRGGATLIQLREKAMNDRDLLRAAQDATAAAAGRARLIVNERPDVAALCGAAGVHLGDEDLPAADARALLDAGALIGVSTHTVEQAEAAALLPVDYVALGPIFPTEHASARRAPVGIEALARACRLVRLPVVAIGGIDLSRAAEALAAGAAGVAVMGDLMLAKDIPQRTAAYLRLTP